MIESLLGSTSCEQVLLYLNAREEGYAREIARFYGVDYRPIRNQLRRLEDGGVLCSKPAGKTVLYSYNPRCPYRKELIALIEKVLTFCPVDLRERLISNRRRPRRQRKPL